MTAERSRVDRAQVLKRTAEVVGALVVPGGLLLLALAAVVRVLRDDKKEVTTEEALRANKRDKDEEIFW